MSPWELKISLAKFRRKAALLRWKLRKWRLGENHPATGCPKCGGYMRYQPVGMTSIRVCTDCGSVGEWPDQQLEGENDGK